MGATVLQSSIAPPRKTVTAYQLNAGELFVRACWLSGLKLTAAAAYMGVKEARLSRQIAGEEHLSFRRMLNLPVTFWVVLFGLVVQERGLSVAQTKYSAMLGRLITTSVSALETLDGDAR